MKNARKRFEVFCDFDGTITQGDTVDILLGALADPEWRTIEERWIRGEIGSRECMMQQVPLIKGGWKAVHSVLETVKVDRTFASFVRWCDGNDIPVTIVSDGLDKVIHHILERNNIKVKKVWANQLIEEADGNLSLRPMHAASAHVVCPSGLCKCQVLDKAGSSVFKVVIGDGRSDFCWANNADSLFAKDRLMKHCMANNISYIPYQNFVEIRSVLAGMLETTETAKAERVFAPLLAQAPV